MLARGSVIGLLLCCVACSSLAPAATPPQLQRRHSHAISLSENRLDAGTFSLDYPANWRVVKLNGADAPLLRLALVAPNQNALFLTQLDEVDPARRGAAIVGLSSGVAIHYELTGDEGASEAFRRHAQRILDSIRS